MNKSNETVEVIGVIDELYGWMKVLSSFDVSDVVGRLLARVEEDLKELSGQISQSAQATLSDQRVSEIAASLKEIRRIVDEDEPIARNRSPFYSFAHVAGAVCKRTERRLIAWIESETVSDRIITDLRLEVPHRQSGGVQYLNKLSDVLWAIAEAGERPTIEE
jgi:cob(I)alamin adenosyltransferase